MHKIKPLKKTAARLRFAVILDEHIQKMFKVSATHNFTDALFYPEMFALTMPLNALLLLKMIKPRIHKYFDIHIQIGYQNCIVLHHVNFPRHNTAMQIPLTPEYLEIDQYDLIQFLNLFSEKELKIMKKG